jgi:hypothetical protein
VKSRVSWIGPAAVRRRGAVAELVVFFFFESAFVFQHVAMTKTRSSHHVRLREAEGGDAASELNRSLDVTYRGGVVRGVK